MTHRHKRVGDGHACLAGQVIVATSRKPQRLVSCRAWLMARRHFGGGDQLDAFQHACNQRRRDAVIAEAALARYDQKPCGNKLAQVAARSRTGDIGAISKFSGGQGLAAHEGGKHSRPCGITDQRGNFDQICIHRAILSPGPQARQPVTVRHRPKRSRATTANCAAKMQSNLEAEMKRTPIRVEPISTYLERRRKGPIYPVIVAGETVYVSGLPPFDPQTGEIKRVPFARQAELVLEQMKLCLETAGSSLDRVLKCNVYCTPDESHFSIFNDIYSRYVPADAPARIFLHVPSWPGPFDIEIDCVAAI